MNTAVVGSVVAGVGVAAALGWCGRHVAFAEQWPMYEALRTTSSIIFAVVGAWMAIVFPERLKLSFKPNAAGSTPGSATGAGQLFLPVVNSTLILCVVMVLGILAPLLRQVDWPFDRSYLRGSSFGLLVFLTLWQVWTVVLTLIPADQLKSTLDAEDARAATRAGMKVLGESRTRPKDELDDDAI